MPASIEDVAKKANVSISTVSRVLNRRNIVNDKTRKRVEIAIRELNYRPNVFARGLMLQQSNILGLVLPDLHGEFYSEIIRGANNKAHDLGYQLMVSSVGGKNDGHSVLSAVSNHGLVDGIVVMVSEIDSKAKKTLAGVTTPFVVLDGQVDRVNHDSVVIDQRHGAEEMMKHLIEDRHAKNIVFVGGPKTNIDTIDRLAAYRETMRQSSLDVDSKDIYHLDFSYEKAFDLGIEKVKEWAESEAFIFAANDEMAAGIIDAAIEKNISVPEEIRVVGFDDTRIAIMTRPRLTTVHVPMSSMGAQAVELLCQRLKEPERPPVKITLHSNLVIRESCGTSRGASIY
ncbi:LacI family DNA-binding transcriptional regulator [Bythopirellula polymerisocia]|uniref:Catabolite control protein A n=1 Tax=Bythopirellula polymerisocia TaxID=2528003 RepID=A0A5C6D275_9BACT|nr:LacI family DNA-binding transcriptional regulator [Bythopirellula polymerisocia]TWU29316.1 Catabolite control protein A [Bythopirellula polymerisocia]